MPFELDLKLTALVVTDPQIDFLSEKGITLGVVGESVTERQTGANLGKLFAAAKAMDMPVYISPHYDYSHDHSCQFEGVLEKVILAGMSANLCVQAHLYELLELGYEVAVVRDATAGAEVPEGDGAQFLARHEGRHDRLPGRRWEGGTRTD